MEVLLYLLLSALLMPVRRSPHMQEQKKLAQIFQVEPAQWGLRGDPYLWREMKETLGDYAYPSTEAQFTALLELTYQRLTGAPLKQRDTIFIERYDHGGMSSGCVWPQFWLEQAIPLLQARYRETK
jgi:hypothetical protein